MTSDLPGVDRSEVIPSSPQIIKENSQYPSNKRKSIMEETYSFEKKDDVITFNKPFILSAKEALVKTKETHLKRIERFIEIAIEKGQTSCEIMPNVQVVSKENIQILKDAGYTIVEKETMLGKEIKISWE